MTRAEIRLMISPTPIGLTPGFLSRGINIQALYGRETSSFTFSVAILQANDARVRQRLYDDCLKIESHLRQSSASTPDGP